MVEGVQRGGRNVVGAIRGVLVLEVVIERKEVHIVHHHVVTALSAQEETHIQKTGSIKPVCRIALQQGGLAGY